jgi:hypothetical protein
MGYILKKFFNLLMNSNQVLGGEYLIESWSDYIDNFSDQDGFEQTIEMDEIIYSLFASYDSQ